MKTVSKSAWAITLIMCLLSWITPAYAGLLHKQQPDQHEQESGTAASPSEATSGDSAPEAKMPSISELLEKLQTKVHADIQKILDEKQIQIDHPFEFTVDASSFMGQPVLCKMPPLDSDHDYYVLMLHFNIPALRNVLGIQYKFVRIQTDLALSDSSKDLKVVSIFPTNQFLNITFENTSLLEATLQPEWNGASAGSVHWANQDVMDHMMQLPTVAGTASSTGSLAWTFYPKKHQPVILGNQTVYAVLALPSGKHLSDTLNMDCLMSYQTSFRLTNIENLDKVHLSIPVATNMTLSQLMQLEASNISSDMKKNLAAMNGEKDQSKLASQQQYSVTITPVDNSKQATGTVRKVPLLSNAATPSPSPKTAAPTKAPTGKPATGGAPKAK